MNQNTQNASSAIVYSAAPGARNHLRELAMEAGLKVVCFENEAICFDNLQPIQPQIVIAETDSMEVIWRFIFALHANRMHIPLLIVSDRLVCHWTESIGLGLPVTCTSVKQLDIQLLKNLLQAADKKETGREHGNGSLFPVFVGQSDAVLKIKSLLPNIIESRDPVLIVGEPGTGKELLARLIVAMSQNESMFIKVDCRELKPELLVNGWFKSTFGNGNQHKPATIFLDHIDQMSTICQAELRLLIDAARKSLDRMGSEDQNTIRFVASSTCHIAPMVKTEQFKKDLFYRLNVIPVEIPPLRDRRDDISLLMDHFTITASTQLKKIVSIPSRQAREMLYLHNWPGNVAELKNQMWRVAETGNEDCLYANTNMPKMKKNSNEYILNIMGNEDLPKPSEIKRYLSALKELSLKGICDEFVARTEKRLMKKALESTNWNRRKAAQLLNISYKSMLNKIKTYGI